MKLIVVFLDFWATDSENDKVTVVHVGSLKASFMIFKPISVPAPSRLVQLMRYVTLEFPGTKAVSPFWDPLKYQVATHVGFVEIHLVDSFLRGS
jgi:hypothetical protein